MSTHPREDWQRGTRRIPARSRGAPASADRPRSCRRRRRSLPCRPRSMLACSPKRPWSHHLNRRDFPQAPKTAPSRPPAKSRGYREQRENDDDIGAAHARDGWVAITRSTRAADLRTASPRRTTRLYGLHRSAQCALLVAHERTATWHNVAARLRPDVHDRPVRASGAGLRRAPEPGPALMSTAGLPAGAPRTLGPRTSGRRGRR
jgi:hypothetical protein